MHLAIVGNSAAALSALESFRRRERDAAVTLVSDEPGPAYSRVLLPYFLRGKVSREGLVIRGPEYYARMGAELVSGVRVDGLDVGARTLELAGGRRLRFDKLLLATGSRPARPPIPGLEHPAVHHLWTLADAVRLDPLLRPGARALVLGSGFVALQAAWSARQRGMEVTVIELDARIMPRVLDAPAARLLHERIETAGVPIHTGTSTEALEDDGGAVRVCARGLEPFTVDVVIVATGARPNDELLSQALEPGAPGIPVGATMQTSVPGVYAAGDVTRGPTAAGGPPEIHALWPTAVEQGKVAGANLAGAGLTYRGSLSMNVTEMFGLTVASLGRFVEEDGDHVKVLDDVAGVEYFKLVSREGVPVGAVALGGTEGAVVLGRLRPYVRWRRALPELLSFIEGRDLASPARPRDLRVAGLPGGVRGG